MKNIATYRPKNPIGKVHLFCDEFTNYNDVEVGQKTVLLLCALGYDVNIPQHEESGRAAISKGLLNKAKNIANKNIETLQHIISKEEPLIGIEPSAILTFRDEYLGLAEKRNKNAAQNIASHTFTIEEFLYEKKKEGIVKSELFTKEKRQVKLHGHCHQEALSSNDYGAFLLDTPENYHVEVIPSGCCGMAGSFGYEAEHYEVSMKIGELVLFPAVRNVQEDGILAAPGTSCRHQIFDGTNKKAFHTAEILYDALLVKP